MSGGEFEFIERIRRQVRPGPQVSLGIGDDTALIQVVRPDGCLATVDMLMEGTDFTFPPATPVLAGRKALAASLSDIAAMAGRPTAALVAVAFPRQRGTAFAQAVQSGIEQCAREFSVPIAGGDTNSWDGPLVISTTVLGEPTGRGAVTRGGGRPGDWILVTGAFGGSLAGRHLSFTPRLKEAQCLQAAVELHAMIDVSDGLAADLWHILDESRVGAIVDAASIPIHIDARSHPSPLDCALGDGEDFELIFTVRPEEGRALLANPPFDTPLTRIGELVENRDVQLRHPDGSVEPLPRRGWTHSI